MNGHDDFESATAAFARHAATMVSDVGYSQPSPSVLGGDSSSGVAFVMSDASKRARAGPSDSLSVASEPRAAKRGSAPHPSMSSSSGGPPPPLPPPLTDSERAQPPPAPAPTLSQVVSCVPIASLLYTSADSD